MNMNMIYNSTCYCVVEFDMDDDLLNVRGGFEIMDKAARLQTFIDGALADRFRAEVAELADGDLPSEEFDDYLSGYKCMMLQPLALH